MREPNQPTHDFLPFFYNFVFENVDKSRIATNVKTSSSLLQDHIFYFGFIETHVFDYLEIDTVRSCL